ncbi:LOW QUALITY PROTEIN: INO80 complex subunit D-B-like [Dendronephthya gigantea]|uniref:LOW QUALITY PROTEIN: INO80 complex subunit D-B-like n=1 Tax=Dendronephthya gigantea TaxID=151771 RepID=UPI00106C103A|nr:LOW QUALITY PROTEIN: INO80 complex subunit D-B-like [Dendronephthya gigantea]
MASSTKNEKIEKERPTTMFEGKNIHSSPVDGKLLCSFSEKTCMQRRLNHYAFCIRHVLEDKNSPFKQCNFVAKYNGQRCTNAIPLKEDRIYCNSHLQVLGLVPKKSRKKKASEQSLNTAKPNPKPSTAEILLPSHCASQNILSKRGEGAIGCNETSRHSSEHRASKKVELLTTNPLLSKLVSTYSQANFQKRNLLPFYGISSSDENESDDNDDLQLKKRQLKTCTASETESSSKKHLADVKQNSRSAKLQRLRKQLHAELLGVRKTIISHNKDVKQSDEALRLLMTAVKTNPALTTSAIHNENIYVMRKRKRSTSARQDFVTCTAQVPGKMKCERRSIPYTKFCYQHILKDEKQQLFQHCTADISPTSKCARTILDLLHDRPLCREHSTGQVASHPMAPPEHAIIPPVQIPVPKPAKKPRKKPQVKAAPAPKPAKSSRKSTKKDSNKAGKSERSKKGNSQPVSGKVKQELVLNRTVKDLNFQKSIFPTESLERDQQLSIYPINGTIKLEQLSSNKNDMFDNDSYKDEEMFDENEMDVDDGLDNDDLSEDLGDITPTGLLRETVLKLPPESPDPIVSSHTQTRVSPVEAFSLNSINEGSFHKPIVSGNRIELPRKDGLCTNDISTRVNPVLRPSRTTVITLPKYSSAHAVPLTRQISPGINTDYNAFKPIGPAGIKSEVGTKKSDPRPIDVNHGLQLFPLSFDPVLNSSVAWGGGGKLLLNNRARPLLLTSHQMNPITFSPPSLSPHVSPQIALGTAFNFDRPTVLQHSNSPSPTLSPFSAHLPNSPHGKLVPRTLRLESRGSSNSSDIHDPFFGTSFDKP